MGVGINGGPGMFSVCIIDPRTSSGIVVENLGLISD